MNTTGLPRWYDLEYHKEQDGYFRSKARFNVAYAGRRSGKTEVAKRRLVRAAVAFHSHPDGYFFFGAPTQRQCRDIYWNDLKRMVPPELIKGKPYETDMTLRLITGTEIRCIGLDVPERAEGRPVDGCILDEFANMKKTAWTHHLRPAVDTRDRLGWVDFIGVPEGRNHYYDMVKKAEADTTGAWDTWHWKSSDILSDEVIQQAREDLDELVYLQEYEGSFVSFLGRAYYGFETEKSTFKGLGWDKDAPLILCFDFNVSPGVCVICQERTIAIPDLPELFGPYTAVIGEIYIPESSNTELVTQKVIHDWGEHRGLIRLYGDATGAIGKTQSLTGSDWDIVERTLDPHFGDRVRNMVGMSNPRERARVNAMNTRCRSGQPGSFVRHLVVDPSKAPNTVKDFEGVRTVIGGSGEIDKKHDLKLTHLTDALGYYIEEEFPVVGVGQTTLSEVY